MKHRVWPWNLYGLVFKNRSKSLQLRKSLRRFKTCSKIKMKQLLGSIVVTPDGPCDRIQNVNESGIFKDYRFIYRLIFIESRFKTFKWIDINS